MGRVPIMALGMGSGGTIFRFLATEWRVLVLVRKLIYGVD